MAVDITPLQNAVARNTTVDGSAAELLRRIPQMMRDAIAADDIADATNINALAAQLEASSDALAAAVTENTPAAGGGSTGEGEGGGTAPTTPPAEGGGGR